MRYFFSCFITINTVIGMKLLPSLELEVWHCKTRKRTTGRLLVSQSSTDPQIPLMTTRPYLLPILLSRLLPRMRRLPKQPRVARYAKLLLPNRENPRLPDAIAFWIVFISLKASVSLHPFAYWRPKSYRSFF
jgi:hypothetical protein